MTEKVKPELEPGQKRRPKGSIETTEIEVRCVFYRHKLQAARETEKRKLEKEQLEKELKDFSTKLNKYQYQKLEYCQKKLAELLNTFTSVKKFVQCNLFQTDEGGIFLTWS